MQRNNTEKRHLDSLWISWELSSCRKRTVERWARVGERSAVKSWLCWTEIRCFTVGCFTVGCFTVGCFTVGCITVGCFTVGCFTVGCSTVGCFTVGCITVGCITVGCITVGCITVGCMTVGCITVGCMTVGCISVVCFTVGCITVGFITVGCFTVGWDCSNTGKCKKCIVRIFSNWKQFVTSRPLRCLFSLPVLMFLWLSLLTLSVFTCLSPTFPSWCI